ncbi:hypothetical protein [Yersinia pekkanenii]|uniref:Uncharacterized protein n=1 Tax=Yersinia pekkanenii TaxID=1288385 RepID=A0A0T9P762_9GAMM|nr:hypothetical protein [Yersinia pekkanenii]CNH49288.1 Uncharacterised protein [Yersinia pekkanenii]CRY67904.1 Uncharacterised protein [Yersinia pekkanenii]
MKLSLTHAIILIPLFSYAENNYELVGKVNGIRISANTCHISFDAENSPYYSSGWHFSDGDSVCKIAIISYLMGKTVRATGEINTENELYTNTVKNITLGVQGIHWPPYHIPD